jgi:Leucine-rich repeat (LRR) protein
MKKAIFLRFVVLCLVFLGYQAKAQMVYIPDSAFRLFLQTEYPTCMNATGDSINKNCSQVLSDTIIDLSNSGISNLTGISVFKNLRSLDCHDNNLTDLSLLPSSLKWLNCNNNFLTSSVILPPSLEYFSCWLNQMTSLPNLPSSLVSLSCWMNQLTNLPTLPTSLQVLDANYNHITNLPSLTASLTFLSCSSNDLTNLPTLPTSIKILRCDNNLLTTLPNIPNSLTELNCNDNLLTSLPSLPSTLKILGCANNPIANLASFPLSLQDLNCSSNQLTFLPSLPSSLQNLTCYNNSLTTLPTLPSSLYNLDCRSNSLTSLPSLTPMLIYLLCDYNQLTSIPSLPYSLTSLRCSNNNDLDCLPDLKNVKYLEIGNTGIQCLPNYGKITNCIPPLSTFPICGLYNTNGCEVAWNINGNVYFDKDSNCLKATNESGISNQKIQLFRNGSLFQQTYSNLDGNYYFDTDSLSIYSTSIDTTSLPFLILCPINATYTDTLTTIDSLKSNRDFAAKCKGIDLAVTSIYGAGFRPAGQRPLIIHAGDFSNNFGGRCAAGVSGSVQIIVSGPCQYVSTTSGALLPTIINGDTLVYLISDFGSIDFNTAFGIEVLVDTFAIIGSQICVNVQINTSVNEIDTANNYLSQCFNIVNSFDPNDKSVYPTYLKLGVDNWLTYNINFQNTGNSEAIDICITDTLDAKLDWSTFELLSYSHFPLVQLYNTGIIKFNYPKIYLPDSTNNEPKSHGYVQFKIKAVDSLAIGSVVSNTANIYFDFNPPVITNTVSNKVVNCQIPISMFSSSICEGDAYLLNGMVYRKSGVFFQHYITQLGCDSTVMLTLTVLPKSVLNSLSICEGTFFDFNGQQLTNAGIYIDSLSNVLGCDSIVSLNLSVIPTQVNINDNFCQGSSYNFNNQQLTSPGIYRDTLINSLGCDSIIILNLSVVPAINNAITQNNAQLSTSGVGSSYNWIDCTTGLIVPNEIANVFNPPAAGSYSAVVYYGNCIDTSACFQFVTTGVAELNDALVNINPNPFQEELTITRKDNRKETLEVYNLLGEQILQTEIQDKRTILSTQTWPAGIYIVKVIGDRDVVTTRVLKY